MHNLLAILILSLLFSACENEGSSTYTFPKESTIDFDDQYELVKVGSKSFPLDSSIGFDNQSLVYFQAGEQGKLSIFNKLDASLHVFDYNTGIQESKNKFDYEGNNGIGKSSNMGHFIDRKDSIFLFNHWESRVYIMNPNAEIIGKHELATTDLPFGFHLMISPTSPVFKVNNTLYITSQSSQSPMKELMSRGFT